MHLVETWKCDTRLAEGRLPKFENIVNYRVEDMLSHARHFGITMHPTCAQQKYNAPTGSIATPKPHFKDIPLVGSPYERKGGRGIERERERKKKLPYILHT